MRATRLVLAATGTDGIDRIGAAVESGRLVVNVRLFSDARDNDFVRRLADRAVLAVLLAADGLSEE
jgi:ubiquinone biosynthesis protein